MAAVGITAVRDAVVALVEGQWDRDNPDDEVIGRSYPDIDTAKLTGRKVYVLRAAEAGVPADRGEDQNDYAFIVLVAEKFPDAGDAPEEWIDERVAWCEWLLRVLGDPRTVRLLAAVGEPTSGLWPEEAEIAVVIDVQEISQRKLFLSQINVTYRGQEEV